MGEVGMRHIAVTATLLTLAFVGGAAAQQVTRDPAPFPGAVVPGPAGTAASVPMGAAAGASAGAAAGAAVAGPVGAVVGAPVGAVTGAAAGAVGAVAGLPRPAAGTCYVVSRSGKLRRDRAGRPLVARC